ncbi:MAG TPA: ZIP family metal transporter [Candidatus Paceibacterota bacterium]|nr:ZIP family metal transporter [Candidatus Paceibacterota bacterium]
MTFLLILLANLLVSFISIFTFGLLSINHKKLNSFLLVFIAFAAGALLGDAFIHILPESSTLIGSAPAFIVALLGFSIFFLLEKILHYHHCPEPNCEKQDFEDKLLKPVAKLSLLSDSIHNFFDGLAIGASFLMSSPLGWATTFGIMVHEIPQELGDNAVLLYSGLKRKKVLFYNYLVSLTSFLGSLVTYFLGSRLETFNNYVLPFVAGSFIYLAASDLVPELKEEKHFGHFVLEFLGFLLGIGAMFAIWMVGK